MQKMAHWNETCGQLISQQCRHRPNSSFSYHQPGLVGAAVDWLSMDGFSSEVESAVDQGLPAVEKRLSSGRLARRFWGRSTTLFPGRIVGPQCIFLVRSPTLKVLRIARTVLSDEGPVVQNRVPGTELRMDFTCGGYTDLPRGETHCGHTTILSRLGFG